MSQVEFEFNEKNQHWIYIKKSDPIGKRNAIKWTLKYFEELGIKIELDEYCTNEIKEEENILEAYSKACDVGLQIKEKPSEPQLPTFFQRTLMPYQKQSVSHIINVGNAANYSVPGSGKTTITYAAKKPFTSSNKIFISTFKRESKNNQSEAIVPL